MNDFQQIQETKFSQFYLDNFDKLLNNLKNYIEKIQKEYTNLLDYIKNEILSSDIVDCLNKKINTYINWIDDIKSEENHKKDYKLKEKYNKRIMDTFDEFIDIYQNEYLENINKSIDDIKKIFEDIKLSFDPPKINNSSDELINVQMTDANLWEDLVTEKSNYSSFYDINISILNFNSNDNYAFECYGCKNKKTIYYCQHCNCYCCEECYNKYQKYKEETNNHLFIQMNDEKIENEEKKNEFMKSSINFIQNFLIKCNYIMKNEKQNYVDPNTYKKFQYPFIQNEDNINNQTEFLMEINETYKIIKEKIDINKLIKENELNKMLLSSLKKICGEKQFDSFNLDDIDNDFYSDE
jgi:hypothetical protein